MQMTVMVQKMSPESESDSEEEHSGSDDDQEDSSKEANKVTGKIAIALQKAAPGPKVNPFEDKPKVKFGFDEEEGAREKAG
jgi:DNA/RNA-binding protein KIN17